MRRLVVWCRCNVGEDQRGWEVWAVAGWSLSAGLRPGGAQGGHEARHTDPLGALDTDKGVLDALLLCHVRRGCG